METSVSTMCTKRSWRGYGDGRVHHSRHAKGSIMAITSSLGYRYSTYRYPASLCTSSVNDKVVHGNPGERVLKEINMSLDFYCHMCYNSQLAAAVSTAAILS